MMMDGMASSDQRHPHDPGTLVRRTAVMTVLLFMSDGVVFSVRHWMRLVVRIMRTPSS